MQPVHLSVGQIRVEMQIKSGCPSPEDPADLPICSQRSTPASANDPVTFHGEDLVGGKVCYSIFDCSAEHQPADMAYASRECEGLI